MKQTHETGTVGEARVIFEAAKRGYAVSIPYGHDTRYDLVVDRNGKLERVQVKTTNSDGEVVRVKTRSIGKVDGVTVAKQYTAAEIDWIVVYDKTTDRCAFIPATELGSGRYEMNLRLTPAKSNRVKGVRLFSEYQVW